ncbi:MAG TPA: hypothetical protein VGX78_00425 [Pirellulales bacterium]|jgi:hypothetical protein|nr:hypothetical protein [Pirellulales bacterium]
MVSETFAQALRAFARRKPFKPFVVELVNGERVLVEHPEALAFYAGAAVYISPQREFALFDHENVADVRDVPAQANAS